MNTYIDIDHTICYYDKPTKDYTKAIPDHKRIEIVNALYDKGHTITMWTARGTVTGIDWTIMTEAQLDVWGVKYHKLKMGKPAFDLFIDDKALTNLEQLDLNKF